MIARPPTCAWRESGDLVLMRAGHEVLIQALFRIQGQDGQVSPWPWCCMEALALAGGALPSVHGVVHGCKGKAGEKEKRLNTLMEYIGITSFHLSQNVMAKWSV